MVERKYFVRLYEKEHFDAIMLSVLVGRDTRFPVQGIYIKYRHDDGPHNNAV